jgi:hypothetical protein
MAHWARATLMKVLLRGLTDPYAWRECGWTDSRYPPRDPLEATAGGAVAMIYQGAVAGAGIFPFAEIIFCWGMEPTLAGVLPARGGARSRERGGRLAQVGRADVPLGVGGSRRSQSRSQQLVEIATGGGDRIARAGAGRADGSLTRQEI